MEGEGEFGVGEVCGGGGVRGSACGGCGLRWGRCEGSGEGERERECGGVLGRKSSCYAMGSAMIWCRDCLLSMCFPSCRDHSLSILVTVNIAHVDVAHL